MPADKPRILTVEEVGEILRGTYDPWWQPSVRDVYSLCRMARAVAWLHENHGGGMCVGTTFGWKETEPRWEVTDCEGGSHGKHPHPVEAIESAEEAGRE